MNTHIYDEVSFIRILQDESTDLILKTKGITTVNNKWQLEERIVPDHLLYYIAEGTMEASLNKNSFRLKTGNFLWVQPLVKQKFYLHVSQPETKVFFARFQLKKENVLPSLENEYTLMDNFSHLQNHFYEFINRVKENSYLGLIQQKAFLAIILCDILHESQENDLTTSGLKRNQIDVLQKYIQENMQKRFSSADLAKLLQMNQDYFSRQFKKTFKQSPKEYIAQERIQKAAYLLQESNKNINELAVYLGYTDVYQFSRQFKKIYHQSPNQFRKNQ